VAVAAMGGASASAAAAAAAAAAGEGGGGGGIGGLLAGVVEAVQMMASTPATNADWCVRVACLMTTLLMKGGGGGVSEQRHMYKCPRMIGDPTTLSISPNATTTPFPSSSSPPTQSNPTHPNAQPPTQPHHQQGGGLGAVHVPCGTVPVALPQRRAEARVRRAAAGRVRVCVLFLFCGLFEEGRDGRVGLVEWVGGLVDW
jgi:hypothetical protein